MNEKEDNSHSDDQEPQVLGHHDPEIEERKPPNDKIIYYKLVENREDSDS
ncbi:MAG: hypothetical protein ACFFCI_24495 [Promethearchaeota archaeon]